MVCLVSTRLAANFCRFVGVIRLFVQRSPALKVARVLLARRRASNTLAILLGGDLRTSMFVTTEDRCQRRESLDFLNSPNPELTVKGTSLESGETGLETGKVFWITGLAGAGKTTLAKAWKSHLEHLGRSAVLLDGDDLRKALDPDCGYSLSDRQKMSFRYSKLSALFSSQGIDVVVATISMFHSVRDWNRGNIPNYFEILIAVPEQVLLKRNQKNLYRGDDSDVAGASQKIEWPTAPDITLTGTDSTVEQIENLNHHFFGREPGKSRSRTSRELTKAETLQWLQGRLRHASVMPLHLLHRDRWDDNRRSCITAIMEHPWASGDVIVRSSALGEDSEGASAAGKYTSILNVSGIEQLEDAIDTVTASYNRHNPEDQVLIQPMVSDVACSGVVFTRDPAKGSPYYVITYDDSSGRTDTVTSGNSDNLKTLYCARAKAAESKFSSLLKAVDELETIFSSDTLDIEFAIKQSGQICILQVRPLVGLPEKIPNSEEVLSHLLSLKARLDQWMARHPRLHGEKTTLGIMPDWNPAEIIGVRPRPLALSMYKTLITDSIWAYQRHNYGYKNLRSFPLLLSLLGQPYVDTRVSFNSFIPEDIDEKLAEKLVNHYIRQLDSCPSVHDKVEFDLIFSCYTLDLPERLKVLKDHGFTDSECADLQKALRSLTNRIVNPESGLWIEDRKKISLLEERQQEIASSDLDTVGKIYWLIEDCKRYGTLPFAGLARAGFIAVQLLQSLKSTGIFSDGELDRFMTTVDSGFPVARGLT